MWASRDFLRRCWALHERGYFPHFEAGQKIARGYADAGTEEFCVLAGGRIVSLQTGSQSIPPEGHEHHFWVVPNISEMVELLNRTGFDLHTVHYEDQRCWIVTVTNARSKENLKEYRHAELECAMADALLGMTEQ